MLPIILSLVVAIVGLLMYALSSNTRLVEIGRIAFACGLLACLVIAVFALPK
jgi:hypothetical protein